MKIRKFRLETKDFEFEPQEFEGYIGTVKQDASFEARKAIGAYKRIPTWHGNEYQINTVNHGNVIFKLIEIK